VEAMKEKERFTTGEIAKKFNLTRRTLHFYEEIGLISPSEKGSAGQRFYSAEQFERIGVVAELKELGLPLRRIREIINVRANNGQSSRVAASELSGFIGEALPLIGQRIDLLRRMYDDLNVGKEVLHTCRTCDRGRSVETCRQCDVMHRESLPRIVRAVWL
jgi:DNA-binding transcriptional MerR regulator